MIDAIISRSSQSKTFTSVERKAIMAKPIVLEIHSSSDSEDENGKLDNSTAGAADGDDGKGETTKNEIPDKDPSDVAFASEESVSNCIEKLVAYKNYVSRVGNKVFSFSKKKAFGKFLALPKSDDKPTSMESNMLQAYELIKNGFVAVQAFMKENLIIGSGLNVYSDLLDEIVVKMYCKCERVVRKSFRIILIDARFQPLIFRYTRTRTKYSTL